jgi:Kef-type K+ transport system membrane component KefB
VSTAFFLLVGGLALSGGPGGLDALGRLALGLAIILTGAQFGGHIAGRVGQPAVLGEVVAGILLGNLPGLERLAFVGADPYLAILSQVGMLLLLFEVGVGLSVHGLFAVGPSSLFVAVIGTVSSLALGAGTAALLMRDSPFTTHIFVGAAVTATSIGITARVLKDMAASRSDEAKIILGAAVIDDVAALVVLGAVTAWVKTGPDAALPGRAIAALAMKTIGFLVLAITLGVRLTPIWFKRAARLRTPGALLATALCLCFFLSWAANAIGLAALIGAFAAGLVLEDQHSEVFVQRGERPLGELLAPMTAFLVPVFFVLVGFHMNLSALGHLPTLTFALALSLAAIAGKLACAAGVLKRGVKRLTVAIGMIPRGEVTLVFAALGGVLTVGQTPLLDARGYSTIVTVVIVTTLVTPPALKWTLRQGASSTEVARRGV